MPGCGVSSGNAGAILQATGANEIHASARKSVGNPDSDEYARKETDVSEVKAIVEAIAKE